MSKVQSRGAKAGASSRAKPAGGLAGALTRRQRRRLGWIVAALAVVLVVFGAGWFYEWVRPAPGTFVKSLGNDHIPTPETPHIAYNSDPPTSGPHLPNIAPWGVWDRPIPKELQVHNLEDGGVVVNYRPDCADRVLEPLRQLVKRYPDHVILAPYPGLDRCIALTAWSRIDKFDEVDEKRVVRFIDRYRLIDHHPKRG